MPYDIFYSEAFTKKKADAVRDYLVKTLSHYKGKPVLLDDFPEGLLEIQILEVVMVLMHNYLKKEKSVFFNVI